MNPVAPAVAMLAAEIADLSAGLGKRVVVDESAVLDRSDSFTLDAPGIFSPNRSCRLVQAADGWIAVNLPREEDRELVPAWLAQDAGENIWVDIVACAREKSWRDLVDGARTLGLPIARVGEVHADRPEAEFRKIGASRIEVKTRLRVIDLSSMWAGPLCGALLAEMGADVTKLESVRRPDAKPDGADSFFSRLNGKKTLASFDHTDRNDLKRLRDSILGADVVITSARLRTFEQWRFSPADIFAENAALVWVAISGYGWSHDNSDRVAFGDDAAAAGGLVRWTENGEPHFLGDALADPITGLAAAAGAMKALAQGGGYLVDMAMARAAAGAATLSSRKAMTR